MLLGDETVDELYQVRLILEPAAAAMAAKHRTDEDLLAMRRARTHFVSADSSDPMVSFAGGGHTR